MEEKIILLDCECFTLILIQVKKGPIQNEHFFLNIWINIYESTDWIHMISCLFYLSL